MTGWQNPKMAGQVVAAEKFSNVLILRRLEPYLAMTPASIEVAGECIVHFNRGLVHSGLLDGLARDVHIVADQKTQDLLSDDRLPLSSISVGDTMVSCIHAPQRNRTQLRKAGSE
jgi:hypothetical protein